MQPAASSTISYSFSKKHGVLLLALSDQTATIAYHSAPQLPVLLELQRFLARALILQTVSIEEFQTLLTKTHETDSKQTLQIAEGMSEEFDLHELIENMPTTEDLLENQHDAPIIRLLNALLSQAIKLKASDIHIETFEEHIKVRFRIDGILREVIQLQRVLSPLIVSRLKVMAKLDIAEKRMPQDGRITLRVAGHTVDVRIATMPANHGERLVLRLLDKKVARLDLAHLGMPAATLTLIEKLIAAPHGIILVTGPTGSGKTTSLYAMLTDLNDVKRNILTIEDPIEFDLPGIGQTQVNQRVDMTFAKGLRAILRQDPDVVMVGEIRDAETASIAVQASLTGHLVLSTLHTNTAIGAITRLRDMGVEEFLLASSLIGVVAQRLIRLLCPHCKIAKTADQSEKKLLNLPENEPCTLFRPQGCEHCNFLGYHGRTGIYEVVCIDDTLQQMIHQNKAEQELEYYARTLTASMRQDALPRILAGETTLEEILRVTT